MPKVLRIINRFNLGGPTHNAAILTQGLAPEFQTTLVGARNEPSEASSLSIADNLEIKPIIIKNMQRSINLKKDYLAYKEIKKIIREFKPDIVHTHASKAGLLGRLAAVHCNVPVILHTFHGHVFHSYFGKVKTEIYKRIERYLAKKSNAIIAISELQKIELSEKYSICSPQKIKTISLGFQLEKFQTNSDFKRKEFRKLFDIKDEEVAIGIIGRLVPIKNHQFFMEVVQEIWNHSKRPINIVIIGDGEEKDKIVEYSEKIVENNTTQNQITFTSWFHAMDLALAGLDIVTLTSLNEGTPVSLIEAQAAGKPIVSTKVGGIPDIVLENESAFLSELSNQNKFISDLLKLIENEELRKKMGEAGVNFAFENFNSEKLIKNMKSLYIELLNT